MNDSLFIVPDGTDNSKNIAISILYHKAAGLW
jgi:hypothetical protein